MMLVRNDPPAALLAQPDGESKTVVRILLELFVGPAAEEGMRERDIVASGDVERDDLE